MAPSVRTEAVATEVQLLDAHEKSKVGPQRHGINSTDVVATEVQPLHGRKVREVGPQRNGTVVTEIVAPEVELLDRCKAVSYTHLTLPTILLV